MSEVGGEKGLRLSAVWTPGLGKYDDLVGCDGVFDGLFSGHGCSGRRGFDSGEECPDGPVIYAL